MKRSARTPDLTNPPPTNTPTVPARPDRVPRPEAGRQAVSDVRQAPSSIIGKRARPSDAENEDKDVGDATPPQGSPPKRRTSAISSAPAAVVDDLSDRDVAMQKAAPDLERIAPATSGDSRRLAAQTTSEPAHSSAPSTDADAVGKPDGTERREGVALAENQGEEKEIGPTASEFRSAATAVPHELGLSGTSTAPADNTNGVDEAEYVRARPSPPSASAAPTFASTVTRGPFHQCGTARRVKVYELRGESWFDRGTGFCAGVYDEILDDALLVARKEDNVEVLVQEASPVEAGEDVDGARDGRGEMDKQEGEGRKSAGERRGEKDKNVDDGDGKEPANVAARARQRQQFQHWELERTYVVVVGEDLDMEMDLLLRSRVAKEDVYQRQQDTLIVWTEPNGVDMALSFQEAEGCAEVWEFVTEVQKHFVINEELELLNADPGSSSALPSSGPIHFYDAAGNLVETGRALPGIGPGGAGQAGVAQSGSGSGVTANAATNAVAVAAAAIPFDLPAPELGNLQVIEAVIKALSGNTTACQRAAQSMLKQDYIRKLCLVFQEAEDLEALPSLHSLCTIMQGIMMLGENLILDYVLKEDVFFHVLGMLEYDPEYPKLKASYRAFLSNPERYRQVVQISDPTILNKIHQTYRLLYLKDVVLARVLDDPTFANLNSFIFFNQVDIVNFCSTDDRFLAELYNIFDESEGEEENDETARRRGDAVIFLQQLCAMGKNLQLQHRLNLYRTLIDWGLPRVVEYALQRRDQQLRNAAAEVLMIIIEYDPSSVRIYILQQAEAKLERTLMSTIVDILHREPDLGLKSQMAESLRVLLEDQQAAGQRAHFATARPKGDPDKFLDWFYDKGKGVEQLFQPLHDLPDFRDMKEHDVPPLILRSRSALLFHLCDLLCYVIAHHEFRSQFYVCTPPIAHKVAFLLRSREKHIRLTAIRFFRACIARNNAFLNRELLKREVFTALLETMERESVRDNLVCSACLELFEHIRKTNPKPIIDHIVTTHRDRLEQLMKARNTQQCFTQLFMRWEQNNAPKEEAAEEEQGEDGKAPRTSRRNVERFFMDADEESYFNTSDDESDEELEKSFAAGAASSTASREPHAAAGSSRGGGRARLVRTQAWRASPEDAPIPVRDSSPSSVSGRSGPSPSLVDYDDDGDAEGDIDATAVVNSLTPPADSTAAGQAATATVTASTVTAPSEPPPSLREKRRREEEDEEEEDIMGRLSARAKKDPPSSAQTSSPSTAKKTIKVNLSDSPGRASTDSASPNPTAESPSANASASFHVENSRAKPKTVLGAGAAKAAAGSASPQGTGGGVPSGAAAARSVGAGAGTGTGPRQIKIGLSKSTAANATFGGSDGSARKGEETPS